MRRPRLLPDLGAELMAVHAGHGNVQQGQVGKTFFDFLEGISGPVRLGDGKASLRQGATDGIAHRGVVADVENTVELVVGFINRVLLMAVLSFQLTPGRNVPSTSMTRSNSVDLSKK